MTVAPIKTKAEQQLAEQFAAIAPELPGGAWVPAARARAFRAFEAAGLPHRRIEAWKYTDLRTGIATAFPPARCQARRPDAAELSRLLGTGLAQLPSIRFVLVNGRSVARLIPPGHEPGPDYQAGALAGVLGQPGYEWLEAAFAGDAGHAGRNGEPDPVRDLNAAFTSDGLVLQVAAGKRLGLPIHIVSIVDAASPAAVATRHLIRIGAGATATIIESHVETGGGPAQATAVARIDIEAGATAHHIKHVAAGPGSAHLGRADVRIGADAVYRRFELTASAGLLRNETHVGFAGADASLDLSGAMLGRGRDHIDTTLVVRHDTTGCQSRELYKAVLDGSARAVFQGKVVVAPEAQKTDGKQMAKALMLSPDAEFDSKPELEIYADDVACGHGSTAAEIDPAMLFYLRSRGIPQAEARAMLIESFVSEALEKVEDEAVRGALVEIALGWLGRPVPAKE